MRYSLVGDTTAIEYFYVNPTTGVVSIKKPLSATDIATFKVSHVTYDRHSRRITEDS